jgi:hypothetical protein
MVESLTLYVPSNYNSRTWAPWPVAELAVKALFVMGVEWTTLDFIEHAPLLMRVATFVLAGVGLGVFQAKDWLKFKGRHYFSVSLSTLLVLWLAAAGYSYWRFGETAEAVASISVAVTHPLSATLGGVGPSVQPLPAPLPAKYSELEKEDLRNATREVSKILDGQGAEVDQKINDTFVAWNAISGPPHRGDPQAVERSLESLSKSITLLRIALRDYAGSMQVYRSYADDISPLLNLSWASPERNALLSLGQSAGHFRQNLSVLEEIVKCSDQNLLNSVFGLDFGESDLQAKQRDYQTWLQQTKRRIAAFRESRL